MASIQKALIYLDDANNFPVEVDFTDIQGSTGIVAGDGSTIIPQIKSADNLTLRFVNFAPPPSSPGSKFGGILAIAYVYDNGAKSWVKDVTRTGPNASNLTVAIGSWVDGKTYAQAKADSHYAKPYIGYADATDYAEYRIEDYTAPTAPPDPPVIHPITVNIIESTLNIKKGDTATLHGEITTEAGIVSYGWSADSAAVQQSAGMTQAVYEFPQPGTYTVNLQALNSDNQTGQDTAIVNVRDLYPISVDIVEDSQQLLKGSSLQLHASVTTVGIITARAWTFPYGVDVQSQNESTAILSFNRIGTYEIKFGARNEDAQEAYDSIVITVVEAPKKEIDQALLLDLGTQQIEVNPSVTLNDYAVNKDNIKLRFRNSGESTWTTESFSIDVGRESFKFQDGTTTHSNTLTRGPGADYTLQALIQDFKDTNKYTIVIKCVVQDDQGQSLTRFYELKWFAQQKPEYPLEIYNPAENATKLPNTMKRNSRYRGQRESEKVLSDHQEQIYDIRQQYVDIGSFTELQQSLIESWFRGENEAPAENITIAQTKTFSAFVDQTAYPLNPGTPESQYTGLVIQLNGERVADGQFHISDGYLIIERNALQNGIMLVSYTVTLSVEEQKMSGIFDLKSRMQMMDERLGEMERRYGRYENAYQ
ncbi:hypothetical protein SAMN02799624_05412 [Paenibacillus sp. UNC496MF]|uniref:PKD domain-containing protein n=1 Tax=Paenibacillus sp. UNC496MF TaxID=1502753 RepID=UPI0008ED0815|nr:PKD domain-containing protein [Paenibacillus sp. UNC496MF]SFJ65704.1 hypothetical protein SAMN02799624_05412 [Paenibacillus sp. UNC496MF]